LGVTPTGTVAASFAHVTGGDERFRRVRRATRRAAAAHAAVASAVARFGVPDFRPLVVPQLTRFA
jgi:hypothetical protein